VFSEVCGEAGSICEETLADWFGRLQVPVWTGTCVQCKKNSGSLQFHYRLVSLYRYFIVIAWSIKQWTVSTYQWQPTQLHYITSYQHRTLEDTVGRSQNMMADNGWCWTFYETLRWWCTYLTCGIS
jgi:hypothetical protein